MGCVSSKGELNAAGSDPVIIDGVVVKPKGAPKGAPKALPKIDIDPSKMQAFHSSIRWGKTVEIEQLVNKTPQLVNATDPGNGNAAIHIAAQNGHLELVKFFIKHNADVNMQNDGGQTALHMAYSYDLADVVRVLKAAGADGNIKNEEGHAAKDGLSGEKDPNSLAFKMDFLKSADTTKKLLTAMDKLLPVADQADKALVVQMALKAKREHKSEWTPAVQTKLGELMTALG